MQLRPSYLAQICLLTSGIALAGVSHAADPAPTEPSLPHTVCRQWVVQQAGPEQADASQALQQALNQCPAGSALKLVAGVAHAAIVSGPLQLPAGVSVWLDRGVTLYASTDPSLYDRGDGRCGRLSANSGGCRPLISIQHGHDQGLYGEGVIDGQGGQRMGGGPETWWQLARRAQREHSNQNAPRLIQISQSDRIVLDRLTLRNAPNFHVALTQVNGFVGWGLRIATPGDARNTDGIDPGSSSHVLLAHNWISTGDDNVAIKAGSTGPSRDIRLLDNHFYSGHGISIGSETNAGVSAVRVDQLSLDGTTNGIRIKSDRSRGGLVTDVEYDHVCMRQVRYPLVLDAFYDAHAQGDSAPEFRDIRFNDVASQGGGSLIARGLDGAHPLSISWRDVQFLGAQFTAASHLRLQRLGGAAVPLPSGADVSTSGPPPMPATAACAGAFPAFSELADPVATTTLMTTATGRTAATPAVTAAVLEVGPGHYPTIQAALAVAAPGAVLRIAPGIYPERLHLDTPDLQLIGTGASPDAVRITASSSAADAGGTAKTATVFARADGLRLANLSIENAFSRLHPAAQQGAQAVALAATGDRQQFDHLHLIGYQDTLFAGSAGCAGEHGPCRVARQTYTDSRIDGAVDFIFGDALAYFLRDELHAVARRQVTLTAQSRRYPAQASAYVFDHCRVVADPAVQAISLGRPWRAYATVVFIATAMDPRVIPRRFSEWSGHPALATASYIEYPDSMQSFAQHELWEQVPGRQPVSAWRPPSLFDPARAGWR